MEHRVSPGQIDELLEYLAEHPSLVKGVGLGARSKEAIDREWNNLASRLNAHGRGASKTGQRWKRYWADLKFKTKTKASTRRREASGTGGGPVTLADLTEVEKKILGIIGEGAVSGDIQHRVPILISQTQRITESSISNTQSTSTQSTSTQSTSVLNVKEIEGSLIDYHDEVNATESPPPSVPASFQPSPSTRGHTRGGNTIEATAAAPDSPRQPPASSGRIFDTTEATTGSPSRSATSRRMFGSPVSRRQLRQPRRISSTLTREPRTSQRTEPSWIVELERRRADTESRLADAAMIIAEAARMQAEAARMQAEALRDNSAAINKLLEILTKK